MYLASFTNESKSQVVKVSTHKFCYTEEMLQTRLIEGKKEKQVSYKEIAHTKTEIIDNDINEITIILECSELFDDANRWKSEQKKDEFKKETIGKEIEW